jgi:hypothetical protein
MGFQPRWDNRDRWHRIYARSEDGLAISYWQLATEIISHAVWLYRVFSLSLRAGFGPCARRRLSGGISTKCLSRSRARRCSCGALSIMKARFSTS